MKTAILTHSPSAGGTIRQFFLKTRPEWETHVIASYDEYSHGPLLASGTSNEFFRERQAFWKSLDLSDRDMVDEPDLNDEHRSLVKTIQSVEKTELWITDSVQDVFYAVVTLHLLALDGIDTSCILVRSFGEPLVKWGLGAIRIEDVETLYTSTEAVPSDLKLYSDAWIAISQGSGEAINRFIAGQDSSQVTVNALSAYLLRFADFNAGLGSIERSLLRAGTCDLKNAAYIIGNAIGLGEPENDQVGDVIIFRKLVELATTTSDPWFKLEGDQREIRGCSAQLTESGKTARAKYFILR